MSVTERPRWRDKPYDEVRKAWAAANLRPLWESAVAHKVREGGPKPHLWPWQVLRPLVERGDQGHLAGRGRAARAHACRSRCTGRHRQHGTTNLTTALQILLPGEAARPHRHTMNALRFVIEGNGASTKVDGKDCLMEEGDLIITPGWTWHEHVHQGQAPIIWLDALDAPLHRYLGTDVFEPGPTHDMPGLRR